MREEQIEEKLKDSAHFLSKENQDLVRALMRWAWSAGSEEGMSYSIGIIQENMTPKQSNV